MSQKLVCESVDAGSEAGKPDSSMNAVPRKELAKRIYEGMRAHYGPSVYRPWQELGPLTRSRFLMLVAEMESVGLIDPAYPEHNP